MKKLVLLLLIGLLSGCQLLIPKPEPMLEQTIDCYHARQCFHMWYTGTSEFTVMSGKIRKINTENYIKTDTEPKGSFLAWEMERKPNQNGTTTIHIRLQCLNKNYCSNYAFLLNTVYRDMKSDQIRYEKEDPYFVDPSKMEDKLAPPSPPHVVQ